MRVVVEQGDGTVRAVRCVQHRLDQLAAGVAGAEHDDRAALGVPWAQVVVLDEAGEGADDEGDDQCQEGGDERHGARHRTGQCLDDAEGEDRHAEHRQGQRPDLLEAAVVVVAAVQPEHQADHGLQGDGDRHGAGDARPVDRIGVEVVAGQRRHGDGDRPGQRVEGELHDRQTSPGQCVRASNPRLVARRLVGERPTVDGDGVRVTYFHGAVDPSSAATGRNTSTCAAATGHDPCESSARG